jgi:hypothetical protein
MIDVPVAAKPDDNPSRGRLRALYDWVTRAAPSPPARAGVAKGSPREALPTLIAHYAISRKLGHGTPAVLARGAGGGERQPSERLPDLRDRRACRRAVHRLCDVGEHERGLAYLRRAVANGYFVAPTLSGSPHFDALRGHPGFQELLAEAEAGRDRALAAFREAGGERLLGR